MDLKVLMVGTGIYTVPPKTYGAVERHIYYLSNKLAEMGVEVHLLSDIDRCATFNKNVIVHEMLLKESSKCTNALIAHYSYKRIIMKHMRMLFTIPRILKRIHKTIRPDVVHAHTAMTYLLSRSEVMPHSHCFIFTEHNTPPSISSGDRWEIVRSITFPLFDILAARTSNYTIAVSKRIKTVMVNRYGVPCNRVVVIPNGVDTIKFNPNIDKDRINEIKLKYNLPEVYFVYVGRLVKLKGIDIVIRSLKFVQDNNVKFVIVGDGPAKYSLSNLAYNLGIKDRIIFLGTISNDDLPAIYANALFFILPSYGEGLSMAMLEAMSSGLPVISLCDTEVIVNGINGFLVRKRDPKLLANYISLLINDEYLRRKMKRNARLIIERNFSWDVIAHKTLKLYKACIQ